MSLDPTWLFLSLITSGVGFVLFVYGKKQQRWPQLLGGIVFSVYPYFTPSVGSLVVVGVLLVDSVEFLLENPQFERVVLFYKPSLERIGIEVTVAVAAGRDVSPRVAGD